MKSRDLEIKTFSIARLSYFMNSFQRGRIISPVILPTYKVMKNIYKKEIKGFLRLKDMPPLYLQQELQKMQGFTALHDKSERL